MSSSNDNDAAPDALITEPPGPPGHPHRDRIALTHHHPGRLRVRALAFEVPTVAERVIGELDGVPGVTAVTHNVKTGSILVEYEPGVAQSEVILEAIADASGLGMPDDEARRGREPAIVAIDATRALNGIVYELTGERTDLRALIPVGMAALAAYSFLKHKEERLPRWDNLVYWSYNIFSQLHRREIEGGANFR